MFALQWTEEAQECYRRLATKAQRSLESRTQGGSKKSSPVECLFKQVHKTLQLLRNNPRHPGLRTHEYHSLQHPYDPQGKVFEAYVQHRTPGAYRVFWCYGPGKGLITILAITAHP
jgi:hypothetical protein